MKPPSGHREPFFHRSFSVFLPPLPEGESSSPMTCDSKFCKDYLSILFQNPQSIRHQFPLLLYLLLPVCMLPRPHAWKSQTALFRPLAPPTHLRMVDHLSKLDDTAPLLHFHYRSFNAHTGCSVPIRRIGTLILVGLPLGFLPLHRRRRFPRSTQEPAPSSRRLHAGHRLDSKQVTSRLIPG